MKRDRRLIAYFENEEYEELKQFSEMSGHTIYEVARMSLSYLLTNSTKVVLKKREKEDRPNRIQFRVSDLLYDEIVKTAKFNNVSVTDVISYSISEYINIGGNRNGLQGK